MGTNVTLSFDKDLSGQLLNLIKINLTLVFIDCLTNKSKINKAKFDWCTFSWDYSTVAVSIFC